MRRHTTVRSRRRRRLGLTPLLVMLNAARARPMRHPIASISPLLFALLAACGGDGAQSTDAEAGSGGTLRLVLSSEPETLMPVMIANTDEEVIAQLVYDRLADIGSALNTSGDAGYVPRLARSWRWSADSLRIDFTLDSAARFHDGEPVTADDVAASFAMYRHPTHGAAFRSTFANVDSVTATDTQTATFWFARRTRTQFHDATQSLWIMPARALTPLPEDGPNLLPSARAPIGSGRFRLVSWTPGSQLLLAADTANYRGRPVVDSAVFLFNSDESTQALWLRTGEIDFLNRVTTDQQAIVASSTDMTLRPHDALVYNYVSLNHTARRDSQRPHPILGDRDVRLALTLALDRRALVRNSWDTLARVALGAAPRFLIPDTTRLTRLERDSAEAVRLLESRGWRDTDGDGVRDKDGVPLRLQVFYNVGSPPRERAALLMQQALRPFGVAIDPAIREIGVLIDAVDAVDFDAYMGSLTISPGLRGLAQTWGSRTPRGLRGNESGYHSARVDSLLALAGSTTDSATAANAIMGVLTTLNDDAAAIWTAETGNVAAVHRRLEIPALRLDGWWHTLPEWRLRTPAP